MQHPASGSISEAQERSSMHSNPPSRCLWRTWPRNHLDVRSLRAEVQTQSLCICRPGWAAGHLSYLHSPTERIGSSNIAHFKDLNSYLGIPEEALKGSKKAMQQILQTRTDRDGVVHGALQLQRPAFLQLMTARLLVRVSTHVPSWCAGRRTPWQLPMPPSALW
eukprot:scaffold64569_cov19-Tisochrysis_lutea.AAC.1